jgi:arsenate reductase
MAEAFIRQVQPDWEVESAGTFPAAWVHPLAIRVMNDAGVDISHHRTKSVDDFIFQSFDYVITVCDDARETCPVFTGEVGKKLHMGFEDPAQAMGTDEEVLTVFRRVRDEISERFWKWAEGIGP